MNERKWGEHWRRCVFKLFSAVFRKSVTVLCSGSHRTMHVAYLSLSTWTVLGIAHQIKKGARPISVTLATLFALLFFLHSASH